MRIFFAALIASAIVFLIMLLCDIFTHPIPPCILLSSTAFCDDMVDVMDMVLF